METRWGLKLVILACFALQCHTLDGIVDCNQSLPACVSVLDVFDIEIEKKGIDRIYIQTSITNQWRSNYFRLIRLLPCYSEIYERNSYQGNEVLGCKTIIDWMGNTLKKISPGGETEDNKNDDIGGIIEKYYPNLVITMKSSTIDEAKKLAEFYRAICEIFEEMNKRQNNTQICVPKREVLEKAFQDNHKERGKPYALTKDEFGKILRQVINDTRASGGGAKDALIYIFGVPITALFLKQTVMPNAVSNDYFIPGITSATVLVLAKLNKI